MEQVPISIALCTYNGDRYIQEQLNSILNQTYKNIELVIVDDCSRDTTYSILKQYASQHPQIKLYQNDKTLGFIKNFEKAIKYCSSPLIALSDQDDIWAKEKLELQANAINDNLLLYHNSEFITEAGSPMNRYMTDVRNFYSGNDNRFFLFENCVSGHSCLFKRELIEKILPFPDNVFHDWWLAYIATSYGSINYLPDILVKYRQHAAANTDILRSGAKKKRDPLDQMQKEAERMKTFTKVVSFKKDIYSLSTMLDERLNRYFHFSLFLFMLKRQNVMMFIQKKSKLSKLNSILKYLWGYKLKKMLNN